MKVVHGGNIYKIAREYGFDRDEILDFSANINPLGLPKCLKEAIIDNIEAIKNYPDPEYRDLTTSIANYLGVDDDYIITGNGATELIFSVLQSINPRSVLLLAPTFGEYERGLKRTEAEIHYYMLDDGMDFNIDVDGIIDCASDKDLLLICNPNNPTGQILNKDQMRTILHGCKENNTFVFIDEAFIDFLVDEDNYSVLEYIDEFDNAFILRAFTKFFAIPGLRLGFGITTNHRLLKELHESKEPWTINTFADLAGQVLLKDTEYIEKTKQFIHDESKYLYNRLLAIENLRVYKPSVNYVFFRLDKGIDLKDELIKKGIMIRSCDNYNNLDNRYYRVAVKDRNANDRLINVIEEILYESKL